ncbi:Esterase/lipase superfamily enzyme [Pseudooceanicola antarcticus]|nr:alpha/beta fold hydrolase [Pseudooceanicola antarcticus]SNY50585.1 Esterase/lipase superfamily enzyme [Pseudooceanicola antarcticus]
MTALSRRSEAGLLPLLRPLLLLCLLLLAGCAARPGPEVLDPRPETEATRVIRIYAATNRALAGSFTTQPAFATAYRYYDISVPEGASGAQIPYPEAEPDPARQMVVVESGVMDRASFLSATRKAARREAGDSGQLGLYVHGYNTRFQEALFRLAQIAAETDSTVAPVLFSWPSRGRPLDYEADRQAALFSRTALSDLVTGLTAGGERLVLFGHSMGGFLVMEVLQALKLSGRDAVLDRLEVVLAAPDIDVFVFASQLDTLGPMAHPIIVLTASDDRALGLSSRISGGRPRLGALPAASPMVAAAARRANVQIIDISAVEADPLGHQRYVGLVQLYARQEATPPALPGAYIFDAISRSLKAP